MPAPDDRIAELEAENARLRQRVADLERFRSLVVDVIEPLVSAAVRAGQSRP